uniref:Uncharacterized protein n=1 Tax=Calcidiscus leptoporus TaxID=127549 RepID=A0A6U5F5R8_9EUKA
MSFARPRNTPNLVLSSTRHRQLEREIESRCAEHGVEELEAIKQRAATKTATTFKGEWDQRVSEQTAHRAKQDRVRSRRERALRRKNLEHAVVLEAAEAKTDLLLRRSVTERSEALRQATVSKQRAASVRDVRNKRKLHALVNKAQPRTEMVLSPTILANWEELAQEKRSRHRMERTALRSANRSEVSRLRNEIRSTIRDGADEHVAVHEQTLDTLKEQKAAKLQQDEKNLQMHRTQLEALAAAAKPRTVVSLGVEHEQRLQSLAQRSEAKQKAQRDALRAHSEKLSALTAASHCKIDVTPPGVFKKCSKLPGIAARCAEEQRTATTRTAGADQCAATTIQAARRGSLGRREAAVARSAASPHEDGDIAEGGEIASPDDGREQQAAAASTPSKVAAKLRQTVKASSSRHLQRRCAITPADKFLVAAAAMAEGFSTMGG